MWSLADLMTLLLVFFVLLYANAIHRPDRAAGESEPAGTTAAPRSTADTVRLPPAAVRASAPLPAAGPSVEASSVPGARTPATVTPTAPLNRDMVDRLEGSFNNDFYVRWDRKQPVFVLSERITFNAGDAMLLADSQSVLKRLAELIAPLRHHQVIVSGHTDDLAIRTAVFPSNWELSAARAASVAKHLALHGVSPQRLVIQGKSEFHPLLPNTSAANRKANRRVEISLQNGPRTPDSP
ncbi:hypothetical protein DSCA_34540 [Desulfosarcina alkanivorans]|uniref:OmpA-like domain-containing protein n=1 Tax=Desulfosarcina alkanivorans TaxID=571177 RepID=A0A5K7YTC3_9BACT|nr:hypothetical protein DSCA_34540 [Desulfosarcina alkanivorans]